MGKRRLPKDVRVFKRTRAKFISKETVWPRSHTLIQLNKRGQHAAKKLSDKERRWLALDGTGGGGLSGNSSIHIDHWKPVHTQWRKIQKLLNKAELRKRKPRSDKGKRRRR